MMASLEDPPANGGVKDSSHPSLVSLCWSDHWQTLINGLWSICIQNQFVDLNVTCRGNWMPAHKLVFAVFSPVLRDSFRKTAATASTGSTNPNATGPSNATETLNLDLVSTQGDVIPYLIEFIYKGRVTLPSKHLRDLLSVAESLQIGGLTDTIKRLPPEMLDDKDDSSDTNVDIPSATICQDDDEEEDEETQLNLQDEEDEDDIDKEEEEDAGEGDGDENEPLGIQISSVASCGDFDAGLAEPETILSDAGVPDELYSQERPQGERPVKQRRQHWPKKMVWRSLYDVNQKKTVRSRLRGQKQDEPHLEADEEELESSGGEEAMTKQDSRKTTQKCNNPNNASSSPGRKVHWRRKRKKSDEVANCDQILGNS